MLYLYLKSLHIIFVVTWFAGLFYMIRLFIYTTEAQTQPEPKKTILTDQYLLMQNRLWSIITHPSAVITLFLGIWLSIETKFYNQSWYYFKILFVIGLYIYHFLCNKIRKDMSNKLFLYSTTQLRIWNEVSTLFLFSIVFLVVMKNSLDWIWGVTGLTGLGLILMVGIKIYKKYRND